MSNEVGGMPQKSKGSAVRIMGSLLFFAAAVAAAVIFISNGMERKKIEGNITALLSKSESEFKDNRIDAAAADATAAQVLIEYSPQPLDEELKKTWIVEIKRVNGMKEQFAQLDAIFSEATKDLSATRDRLLDKQKALGVVTDDNRPLSQKLEALLQNIAQLELKAKRQLIDAALEEANNLYRNGKIVAAADKAEKISHDLTTKPVIQSPEIDSRISLIKKSAEALKDAEKISTQAKSGTYVQAITDVTNKLAELPKDNADQKPLRDSLAAIKQQLKERERLSRRLDPDDEKDLKVMVTGMARMDSNLSPQAAEGETIGMNVGQKPVHLGIYHDSKNKNPLPGRTLPGKNLFVEADGIRFLVNAQQVLTKDSIPEEFMLKEEEEMQRVRASRVLLHAHNLGEAMKKAGIHSETLWDACNQAPFFSARRIENGKEYVFLGDKLYTGKPEEKSEEREKLKGEFDKKAEALEKAVLDDSPTPQEVREMIAEAVHASYQEADWNDHLPGEFVRKVIADNYIERNMPGSAARLKKQLADWRKAYTAVSKPTFNFTGSSEDGDTATEFKTIENHPVWRLYNKAADLTTFAINDPDDEKECLFILYDFSGNVQEFPDAVTPKTVRMTHQAIGVTATYDPAAGKMSFDEEKWNLAATLEAPALTEEYRTQSGLGEASWSLPPHVLLVDYNRNTKAIVTPTGRLDIKDFRKVPESERKAEMSKFLDQMAVVLPTNNYLHLYYRYFHEYLLDSPVTSNLELMGSRTHSGNKQQTTYQSLMRMMGGRFTGDCGDLAELYMDVTRRQGKLSYVMALPQHAACGWVEKKTDEDGYVFYMCDTGPPRIFRDKELDKVIEKAENAYDDDKTLNIDPKSLGFLFRFNNEQTRTPYYLSSRMFVDKEYGEQMERVQSYWHFHFYKLGIETMTAMINKGDRVPENCIELAGLYGWIREVDDSIHWTNEALKQFGPEERMSGMQEELRIGLMWRSEHENQKSYDSIRKTVKELINLQKSPDSMNYTSTRLQFMSLLVSLDRPWEAWELVKPEMSLFANRGLMRIDHAGGLTSMYKKMKEAVAKGKKTSLSERTAMGEIEKILSWFYSESLIQKDDDFVEIMRKYAFLGLWYSCNDGHEKLVEELLKDGPFPDPKTPRDHTDRKAGEEEEDWKWIRLSMVSYTLAIGNALDFDDPPEKWRKDEAVKLADAMRRNAEHTKQFGSLGADDYDLTSTAVLRDFMTKDWKDLEEVIQDVGKRDWPRLTDAVTDTFGRGARFVTADEFVAQYRMMTKYIRSRPAYFAVITEAYKADAPEQAAAATKVAVDCNPSDENMQREAAFFCELAKKKLEKAKAAVAPKTDDKPPATEK